MYAAVAILLLMACKSSIYIPTADNVSKNANLTQLEQGRQLYINKCSSCHMLVEPEKFNKAEWTGWVDRMAPKAKISAEEKALILAYVTKGK